MSDFGKGFAYNLGLFLAHAERDIREVSDLNGAAMWFNGAVDHLCELETSPEILGEVIARDVAEFTQFCFSRRDLFSDDIQATKEDVLNAIRWAKNLLYEWDKAKGVPVDLAEYS